MTETLNFLPWLRRGIGVTLTNRDPGSGSLPRTTAIPAWVEIDHEPIDAPVSLRPADHATAIDPSQIVRRFPSANSIGAEYGYFPLVDVLAPDLPWLLTPATADKDAKLRPWLVLVCVEDAVAQFVAGAPGRPARLTALVEKLPDLAESHAWAHVQSAVAPDQVAAAITDNPGSVIARLVCPRKLAPNTTYRAALVNAFVADGNNLKPAWSANDTSVELIAYDSWIFTTGDAHSFEELCERLGPVDDPDLVFGLHTTDVTELGPIDPWPDETTVTVDYRGALWDAGLEPDILGPLADEFAAPLITMLNRAELHPTIDPDDPDPIVAPPFYGSFAAGADRVLPFGWMAVLNLAPAPRMAAGRGAEVVRRNQERYMAIAWRQAGELRETNRQLSVTRLQGEIGATWKGRADRLDPLERVAVTRSQLTYVRDANQVAPRRALLDSTFPDALASPAFGRATRPGGVVAHAAARRNPEGASWDSSLGSTFGNDRRRDFFRFGVPELPQGTRLADPRHHGSPFDFPDPVLAPTSFDLTDTAQLASTQIAPLDAGVARLVARIPALAERLAGFEAADAPTRVAFGPVIDEALMWGLVEIAPELLLPGVEDFPNNAIRVVESNPAYIASFLAGANHEMVRELLWREYPADLTATTFRRFWDRPDRTAVDIDPIADWPLLHQLEQLGVSGGTESIVLLIRGDVVRHYPNVRVLLVDPDTAIGKLPSFDGWIPPDVRFLGFDVDDAQAVTTPGSGWLIALEELPTEPRFGLDNLAPGDPLPRLQTWDDLAWDHLTGHEDATHLTIGNTFPSCSPAPPDATWGLNSAHMARATYQRPYRRTFPVDQLIGGADE